MEEDGSEQYGRGTRENNEHSHQHQLLLPLGTTRRRRGRGRGGGGGTATERMDTTASLVCFVRILDICRQTHELKFKYADLFELHF